MLKRLVREFLLLHSRLRIWHRLRSGTGLISSLAQGFRIQDCCSCDVSSIPGPGTSICHGCIHKKANKKIPPKGQWWKQTKQVRKASSRNWHVNWDAKGLKEQLKTWQEKKRIQGRRKRKCKDTEAIKRARHMLGTETATKKTLRGKQGIDNTGPCRFW